MKIASILMSLVFAGVIAQANEPAHEGHAAPTTATETKVEKKEVAKKGKHVKETKTEEKKEETKNH